jgi:fatty acid CoA ligase FadD36
MAPLVHLSELPDVPDLVTVDDRSMSTEALQTAVESLARELSGAPSAAVRATASVETVVAVLAGLAAGVTIVPVPADSGAMEQQHILSDSGAAVLLGPFEHEPAPGAVRRTGLEVLIERVGSPALVMYTSGTTGLPKGVPIRVEAIVADIDALADAWQWTSDDVLVHGLPLSHVHGLVLGVLGPLHLGCKLVHTGRPTPQRYGTAARRGGSLFFGVPTVWSRVAADEGAAQAMRKARLLVSGSASLPDAVSASLAAKSGHVPIERYGMTETLITLSQRAEAKRRPGWVGGRIAGIETRLVDNDDDGSSLLEDGSAIGSLEVRGATVMGGYLSESGLDNEAFATDGWFRTGDAAVIDERGDHRIVGRIASDLIKSGGYRIGAGEVEAALLAHAAVRDAAVVGLADDDLGQAIVAYVVADGVTDADLIRFVGEHLAHHKRPRRVVIVAELPRNSMGKVRKDLLR